MFVPTVTCILWLHYNAFYIADFIKTSLCPILFHFLFERLISLLLSHPLFRSFIDCSLSLSHSLPHSTTLSLSLHPMRAVGGMGAVSDSIARSALDFGAEIATNATVTKIITSGGSL